MIVIYKTMTEAEINDMAATAVQQIGEWFANHPDRNICNAELFYGQMAEIHRTSIATDVALAADAARKPQK